MANLCDIDMKIVGDKDARTKFIKALTQDGSVWMGRGAEADISEEDEDYVKIFGYCKWSITSALINNAISMRTNPKMWCGNGKDDKGNPLTFITLPEASKIYNVDVEAYSEESSNGFAEHYIIKKGEIVTFESVPFHEYYIGDFKTKEEAEEEFEISITDEEWESDEYLRVGGYKKEWHI